MSQSLAGLAHLMVTVAASLSTPAAPEIVNGWSFQHDGSSVSKSAQGVAPAGVPGEPPVRAALAGAERCQVGDP